MDKNIFKQIILTFIFQKSNFIKSRTTLVSTEHINKTVLVCHLFYFNNDDKFQDLIQNKHIKPSTEINKKIFICIVYSEHPSVLYFKSQVSFMEREF